MEISAEVMNDVVTFEEVAPGEWDAICGLLQIAQIDKGQTRGKPSQSWRQRLDRSAEGYTVRYGLPDAASVQPERWFPTLEEAQNWVSTSAPRPTRVGGAVKWVSPS